MNYTKSSHIHLVDKSTGNDPHTSISMRLHKALFLHGVFINPREARTSGALASGLRFRLTALGY